MVSENRDVYIFENTHAIRLLLVLLREESEGKVGISKKIVTQLITTSSQSVKDRIDEMEMNGLVSVKQEKKHPRPHIVTLTPLGRQVAEKLNEIQMLLTEG